MSNQNLFRKSGIAKAVLSNGLGRYIPQLQRVTLKFCKSFGGSRGIREFIEKDLIDFAKKNESVVIYVKPRRHRSPVIVAEYLNNERKWLSVQNFSRDEIMKWLNLFVSQSGQEEKTISQRITTQHPSIQGPWNPFYNRNPSLNTSQFPSITLGTYILPEKTATEKLLEIYEKQKYESSQSVSK